VKPLYRILLIAVTVVAIAGGVFVPAGDDHGSAWWNAISLFFSLFGFVGCVAIIYLSKWLGAVLLQRKEEYYDTL